MKLIKHASIFLLIVIVHYGYAQDSLYRVKVFGEIVYESNDVFWERPFKQDSRLIINDTISVPLSKVVYFSVKEGYFERLFNARKGESFIYRRNIVGKRIKLYSRMEDELPLVAGETAKYKGDIEDFNSLIYYVKDNGELKKIEYRNLKVDLADNAKAMQILEPVKNLQVKAGLTYAASFLCMSVGGQNWYIRKENDEKLGIMPTVALAGLAGIFVPIIYHKKKHRLFIKAIETYNQ